MKTRSILAPVGCALCLLSHAAPAADPPDAGAVQRLEREQLEQVLRERRLHKTLVRPEISMPAAPAATVASQTANIPVKGFLVDASAILTPAEIAAALAPYENRTLSLADLMQAVAALNQLYADKAMPTARAILPPQEIRDGMVKIRLVEARVGEIRLGEVTQISPEFVRERLGLASGDLMSVTRLEADLLRFNRLHDVQLRAGVQPGKAVGTTDVLLEAAEPKRTQYSVFLDNAGRYSVGEERLGFTLRRLGLFGRGDSLLFSATAGEGSDSYYLGYSVPLTRDDLKLDVVYSRGGIEVVNGAFVPLDVSGESADFSVGLSKPLVVEGGRLWSVYGRLAAKESISEFGGVPQQNVDLMVLSLGASGEHQDPTSAWTLDVSLQQGLEALGGEADFTALRANAAWLERRGPRTQWLFRAGVQYSPTEVMPSSEQFQLGGNASVRGYSEGALSGRSGYVLSAEWRHALRGSVDGSAMPALTGQVFLDHGGAFPYRPAPLKDVTADDFLTGAGVGVIAEWNNGLSARLALAWPLRETPAESIEREPRIHAGIAYNW